ncbi:MAG: hypothetical protein JW869_05935 [Candidatus Omnitrophica bacterium]|nr:hypothetical protein [Candidatus Omnitrophota bacterium]
MPNSNKRTNQKSKAKDSSLDTQEQSQSLTSICNSFAEVLNQLYSPIDAVNRFINLALQSIDSGSQSRQFLIESKEGIRKTSLLLKRLNNYTKEMEQEILKLGEKPYNGGD